MKVMLVEDEKIMRTVLRSILEKFCSFKSEDIIEVGNGNDAIISYVLKKPGLVICDISLPDIDGTEVVQKIMKIDKEAKIIMCSATGDAEAVMHCMRCGAKEYIVKPPRKDRVINAVAKVTGREF
jgi:two-component system chemotaxis response regulator CheY